MVDIVDASPAAPVPEPEAEAEPAPAHPDPSSIPPDAWRRFESAALGVLNKIQPTVTSEHFRSAVIDYLQRLLGSRAGVQVFPFGSVPLKTYLPDGDIDLTAFSPAISDENLANEVCAIIRSEEHRKDSEFDVKDVQYIHAEVLYRFLHFYSNFDWDTKGISLFGPVSLSSLPDVVTDPHLPAIHDDFFLQREKFLRECAEAFSAPHRNSERDAQVFSRKFLNIVDPLKQSNNLGRSVSKGNFYRIRSAFDFGARKLGKILQMPVCYTVNEVNQFFSNTLKRNHTGFRPDVLVSSFDDGILTYHATNDSLSLGLDRRVNNSSSPLYSNRYGDLPYQFNNILKDLTGDFKTNFHNLQYAQGFQQVNPENPFYYGRLAPPPPQYQNTRPSNGQGRKNPHAYASMNGAVPCPPYPSGYLVWRPFVQPDDPMAMRAHGTGTCFPDPKLCKDGPPTGRGERGRNQFTSNNY